MIEKHMSAEDFMRDYGNSLAFSQGEIIEFMRYSLSEGKDLRINATNNTFVVPFANLQKYFAEVPPAPVIVEPVDEAPAPKVNVPEPSEVIIARNTSYPSTDFGKRPKRSKR